jgi:hypothetical protein
MQLKIENRQQLLTLVAVGIVAVLAADRLVLSPLARGWKARSERIATLKESVSRGQALLDRAATMERRWEGMQEHDLSAEISAAENEVLKSVASWARDSRITFTSMIPQWKNNEEGYWTMECRASAIGDLRAVTRFLFALETDPLAVRLEECEVGSRDEKGQQMTLTVRFSALRLPPEKEGS